MKAIVYTLEGCPYCTQAKRLLRAHKIRIKEIKVKRSARTRPALPDGRQQYTFPQIFLAIGGYDDLSAFLGADKHR